MKTIQSQTTKSGACVEPGPCEYQLYANIGRDGLCAVLEIDTDCPGRVFTYFMRGGIQDSAMTADELRRGALALGELLEIAQATWPNKMRSQDE